MPEPVMVPPVMLHVTAVLVEFATVAVTLWLAETFSDIAVGEMLTEIAPGAEATVMTAVADLVLSATLVAVTL